MTEKTHAAKSLYRLFFYIKSNLSTLRDYKGFSKVFFAVDTTGKRL
jgi:hypothetical protein